MNLIKKIVLNNLKSLFSKTLSRWDMIKNGDKIGLALSGGKDSFSLLFLLVEVRKEIPIDYEINVFYVEMGYYRVDSIFLESFCKNLGIKFFKVETDFGVKAVTEENRNKSPCFFCAMHRRRILFEMCVQHGCSKLALGHHQDDLFETFLLNYFFTGKFSTMLPVQPFFKGDIIVIRPLILINVEQISQFVKEYGLQIQPSCCEMSMKGQRYNMRSFLENLYQRNDKIRANMWSAFKNSGLGSLPF